jgi:hypothetical protein
MSTTLIASPEAILAQIDLLTASVKDLRKATALAFKQHKTAVAATAKAGSKKAKKASGSDSSSVSSGGSRTNTNSWQAWTAYVLPAKGESGTERAERYTEFKEAYTHPVNGTKQGVMIAYLGHRAYLGGSKEGGQTPEYTAFLSAFAERKASAAASAVATTTSVVSIVKSKKPVAAAILDLDDSHSVASTEEREASLGTAIIPMTPSSNSSASLPPPPAKGKKASPTPAKCPAVKVLQLTDGPVAVAGKKKALPAPPASLSLARIETIPESSSNSASSSSSSSAAAKPVIKTVAKKGKKAALPALTLSAAAVPVNPRATMAPWEFNGTTYLKNDVGQVWSAEGEWCGVYNESEDLIDETTEEPVWPPVAEDVV